MTRRPPDDAVDRPAPAGDRACLAVRAVGHPARGPARPRAGPREDDDGGLHHRGARHGHAGGAAGIGGRAVAHGRGLDHRPRRPGPRPAMGRGDRRGVCPDRLRRRHRRHRRLDGPADMARAARGASPPRRGQARHRPGRRVRPGGLRGRRAAPLAPEPDRGRSARPGPRRPRNRSAGWPARGLHLRAGRRGSGEPGGDPRAACLHGRTDPGGTGRHGDARGRVRGARPRRDEPR